MSELEPEKLSREAITKIMFDGIVDDGKAGDCIFVFGSRSRQRVIKAVQLYKAGRAPYILLSGGSRWGTIHPPEAIRMRDQAIEMGVPESVLLLECESNHTTENVLASLMVLERAIGLNKIKRILVVSTPFHMCRCYLTLKTYMPKWIDYSLCPDDRLFGQADNWWKHPEEEQRVKKELTSLIKYIREGRIIDTKINL